MAGQGKAHAGVASANHDGWRRTSSWVNKIRGHKSGFIMAARSFAKPRLDPAAPVSPSK